jgi:hypothetical protein
MNPAFSQTRGQELANMVNQDHNLNPQGSNIPLAYQNNPNRPNPSNPINSIHPNPVHHRQFMDPLPPTIVKEINEFIHILVCKHFKKLKIERIIMELNDAKANNIWPKQLSLQQKYTAPEDIARVLPTLIDCIIDKHATQLNELNQEIAQNTANEALKLQLQKYSEVYPNLNWPQINEFADLCFKTKKAQFIYKQEKDAKLKQDKLATFAKKKELQSQPVVITRHDAAKIQSKISNLTKQLKV